MSYSTEPITTKEARKMLGKEYEGFSDDQIREVILALHLLAKSELVYTGSKKQQGSAT